MTERRLLLTSPSQILRDPDLLARAITIARPVYNSNCARCHGAQFQGSASLGVPNLSANAWLYGNDPIDVEYRILYGIRSGHPKAKGTVEMPAEVRTGQISAADARDVVEFIQKLAGRAHNEPMAESGRNIYFDKGNCYDCHGDRAQGVNDYGTPALTGPVWLYGGDRATLFQSVLNGRHGICPSWINTLAAVEIRALALYLVASNAPIPAAPHESVR